MNPSIPDSILYSRSAPVCPLRRMRKRVLEPLKVLLYKGATLKFYSAAHLSDVSSDCLAGVDRPRSKKQEKHPKKEASYKESRGVKPSKRVYKEFLSYPNNGDSPIPQFCSRSEAICAEILCRYVPHFTLQEGRTFQVEIGRDECGNTLAVDFLVDGVLFEYHPVRFFKNKRRCGDFASKREYRSYTTILHSLRGDQKEFFQTAMRARLTENYYAKRRAQLDAHPLYRRMELVVATSPEEFYELIIKRFGRDIPPSTASFLQIFEMLKRELP